MNKLFLLMLITRSAISENLTCSRHVISPEQHARARIFGNSSLAYFQLQRTEASSWAFISDGNIPIYSRTVRPGLINNIYIQFYPLYTPGRVLEVYSDEAPNIIDRLFERHSDDRREMVTAEIPQHTGVVHITIKKERRNRSRILGVRDITAAWYPGQTIRVEAECLGANN